MNRAGSGSLNVGDPTWAMFVWIPCALMAFVLAIWIENVWNAFAIMLGICMLLDFSPVGAAIRGRNAEKLVVRGYGKRGVAKLAALELAGGLVILVLLALKLGDPDNFAFGAAFAGFFIAQSISTWRLRAELRETAV
ncbi:hypothetical protein ABS767_13500 [Sphingomonas sp. ST-64]|uniref:Uncharacterized protein n=1 Tax=Sphingomonas plantiphila TaxID=3163295 RepID=A0ABW8YPM4_9SPHN